MKLREISEHEFKGLRQFYTNSKKGFGITGTYTNMTDNYAMTKFGVDDKCLLKTEHVNGVNEPPIFYEAIYS